MTEAGEPCSENWGSKALESVGKVSPGTTLKVKAKSKVLFIVF